MRAIIICADLNPALHGLDEHTPSAMVPLGDRPLLQHMVEYFAQQDIRKIDFILSHLPEQAEAFLGTGARWGCRFTFHLIPTWERCWRLLRNICAGTADQIVLASAERFPASAFSLAGSDAVAVFRRENGAPVWSGWAAFPALDVKRYFPGDTLAVNTQNLNALVSAGSLQSLELPQWISVDSPTHLLDSQRLLLDEQTASIQLTGTQAEKGAWVGRNVSIHPTARLCPPFYIGPNTRISAGTKIGPWAVIGEKSIIDEDSVVEDSMVMPGTYLGQGLELKQAIVDRNRLINARLDTTYLISEAFLAGGLEGSQKRPLVQQLTNRVAGLALLLLLSPLVVMIALALLVHPRWNLRRPVFVRTPASTDPRSWRTARRLLIDAPANSGPSNPRWRHFLFDFLPGLLSVATGAISLCGMPQRSPDTLRSLPADWRSLCLQCPTGLVTEAAVVCQPDSSAEELYSAESFYFAMRSFGYDVKLLGRYAEKLITGDHKHALVEDQTSV